MNRVWITGRLAKDPELKKTKKGTSICQFVVAVNRPIIRDGKRETDFVTCIVWNKLAESLVKYQRKGNLLGIQGEVHIDSYETNGAKKFKTYILVQEIEFLGTKKEAMDDEQKEIDRMSSKTETQETISYSDDDLPW